MVNPGKRTSQGQSLVEAALVLPVILMMMLGLLDFGRAYYTVVALRDAADEGAVYAAMNPDDVSGIRLRATQASRRLVQIDPANVQVIAPSITRGAPITVTATFSLVFYTPFASNFVSDGQLLLRGESTQAIISP
jgi:Flp pilus assembly protein TadG